MQRNKRMSHFWGNKQRWLTLEEVDIGFCNQSLQISVYKYVEPFKEIVVKELQENKMSMVHQVRNLSRKTEIVEKN